MENLIYKVNKKHRNKARSRRREEGYNRLENIKIIRSISKSKLAQPANLIEEETFLDEEVV